MHNTQYWAVFGPCLVCPSEDRKSNPGGVREEPLASSIPPAKHVPDCPACPAAARSRWAIPASRAAAPAGGRSWGCGPTRSRARRRSTVPPGKRPTEQARLPASQSDRLLERQNRIPSNKTSANTASRSSRRSSSTFFRQARLRRNATRARRFATSCFSSRSHSWVLRLRPFFVL